jgi:hypothetical protein
MTNPLECDDILSEIYSFAVTPQKHDYYYEFGKYSRGKHRQWVAVSKAFMYASDRYEQALYAYMSKMSRQLTINRNRRAKGLKVNKAVQFGMKLYKRHHGWFLNEKVRRKRKAMIAKGKK